MKLKKHKLSISLVEAVVVITIFAAIAATTGSILFTTTRSGRRLAEKAATFGDASWALDYMINEARWGRNFIIDPPEFIDQDVISFDSDIDHDGTVDDCVWYWRGFVDTPPAAFDYWDNTILYRGVDEGCGLDNRTSLQNATANAQELSRFVVNNPADPNNFGDPFPIFEYNSTNRQFSVLLTVENPSGFNQQTYPATVLALNDGSGAVPAEVWVGSVPGALFGGGYVYKLDSDANILFNTIHLYAPVSLSVDSTSGECWVAGWYSPTGRVYKLNPDDGSLVINRAIGGMYAGVAVDQNTGDCWLGYTGTAATQYPYLSKLRSSDAAPLFTAGPFATNYFARSVNVDAAGNGFFGIDNGTWGYVYKRDAGDGSALFTAAASPQLMYPISIAVHQASGDFWVADVTRNVITKFRGSDGGQIFRIGGPQWTSSVAVDQNTGDCWAVGNQSDTVYKYQASDGALILSATLPVSSLQTRIAVDSSGNLWVASWSADRVYKVDGNSGALLATSPPISRPHCITLGGG